MALRIELDDKQERVAASGRPRRRSRLAARWVVAAWPLVLCFLSSRSLASPTVEYRVKAACILSFMKLSKWPAASHATDTSPFVVAVIGRDPFGKLLEEAFAGKTVRGRAIRVERYDRAEDLQPCHVLFVSSENGGGTEAILQEARRHSTLTIGEREDFTARGGMIRFHLKDEKVRFEINNEAARRQGLEISSKLLKIGGHKVARQE
jgi:hypothetical protein